MSRYRAAASALFLVLFAFPFVALGESVTLNNGDHITGDIEDSDGKALTLKTAYAGDVKIQWPAIKELSARTPIYVTTEDKKTISGSVALNGPNLTVQETSGTMVEVPMAKITAIRSSEGQNSYERSLHPAWNQGWNVGATVGLGLARGNSDTTNFNTSLALDRKTLTDEIKMYESSVYASNGLKGGGVTANAILGGVRYDHNITEKLFAFGAGDFTHDELQGLDIRQIYTGGLGWHLIDKPNITTLDVLAGINYTQETYSGTPTTPAPTVTRHLPGITLGEDFMHKFGGSTTLNANAYFYPDLSDLSQYRFSLDASLATKINNWLAWQVGLSDRYVTNPPIAGTKSNDLILATGLNITFTQRSRSASD
jgi:putative salt-induced outer membrane protein YdiY